MRRGDGLPNFGRWHCGPRAAIMRGTGAGMLDRIVLAVFLVTLVAGCSSAGVGTVGAVSYRKIVAVSDSLTNDEPTNWLALLGKKLNVAVVAEAHGGWSTRSYFKDKFRGEAFARVPADADLAIILLGSNNLFLDEGGSDATVAEAVAGVQQVAAHVRTLAPKARIMLVAPPTVALKNNKLPTPKPKRRIDTHTPGELAKLSRAYRALAQQKGWLFADLYPVLTDADYIDAAHPNAAGNARIAEVIAATLLRGVAAD